MDLSTVALAGKVWVRLLTVQLVSDRQSQVSSVLSRGVVCILRESLRSEQDPKGEQHSLQLPRSAARSSRDLASSCPKGPVLENSVENRKRQVVCPL